MAKPLTFKVYDFTLAAGGSFRLPVIGEYFRLQTSTGAVDVTVEGVGTLPGLLAGQALKDVPFNGLVLRDASGAPNVGTILVASSEFQDNRLNGTVDLSATSLAALESIDLNAATLATMRHPLVSTGNFKSSAAMVANTPETVFTPAANVNGAIVLGAGFWTHSAASSSFPMLLAKASAPTTFLDGEVYPILSQAITGPAYIVNTGKLEKPQFVAPGLGLYYISQDALPAAAANLPTHRAARYRLL